MPSTPRMIQIEAKASQPGEPLTHSEVSEWHKLNKRAGYLELIAEIDGPVLTAELLALSADTHKAIRYLDTPGWKARP